MPGTVKRQIRSNMFFGHSYLFGVFFKTKKIDPVGNYCFCWLWNLSAWFVLLANAGKIGLQGIVRKSG